MSIDVSKLKPGQKVRASFQHIDRPLVGLLRKSYNAAVRESDYLFLDVPASHIVRDAAGKPGFGLRWIEVLPTDVTTTEETLSLVDAKVDNYLTALAAWKAAPKTEVADALEVARAAYAECIEALDAPFEVTA